MSGITIFLNAAARRIWFLSTGVLPEIADFAASTSPSASSGASAITAAAVFIGADPSAGNDIGNARRACESSAFKSAHAQPASAVKIILIALFFIKFPWIIVECFYLT